MAATATTPKKSARKKRPAKAQTQSVSISEGQRRQMIEDAAYYRAEQRGFQGGDSVADWLLSETEIDDLLSRNPH